MIWILLTGLFAGLIVGFLIGVKASADAAVKEIKKLGDSKNGHK